MSTLNALNIRVGQSSTPANNITVNTDTSGDLVFNKGAPGALTEITRIKNNGEVDASKVGYTPAGTGTVSTTVQGKLRESVSVKDFGAVGDGSTDDTPAINAAIAASQYVSFPPGQYKITSPILWQNQWLVGSVDNGILSTALNQTMIVCDGTFPAFKYYNPFGYVSQGGGIKNFNIYFANGLKPATGTTRPNAIGVSINDPLNNTGYPAFHSFENITVRGGTWAIFDYSGSWMGEYKHINSGGSFAGIYKRGGTTHRLNNCHHAGGHSGMSFIDVLGVVVDCCSTDLTTTTQAGYYPVFVENSTVQFNGCDFESNYTSGDYREFALINGSKALVQFNACEFLNPQITASLETYLIHSTNGAKVTVDNCDFSTPSYSAATGLFAYGCAQSSSSIVFNQCALPVATGFAPANPYSGLATTGSIDYNNCTYTYPWQGNSRAIDKSIRYSVTLDLASIAANSFNTLSYTVPGAVTGDFVQVTMSTPINGVLCNGWVNGADTVAINFYNVTASAIDLPSTTIRLKVTQA